MARATPRPLQIHSFTPSIKGMSKFVGGSQVRTIRVKAKVAIQLIVSFLFLFSSLVFKGCNHPGRKARVKNRNPFPISASATGRETFIKPSLKEIGMALNMEWKKGPREPTPPPKHYRTGGGRAGMP